MRWGVEGCQDAGMVARASEDRVVPESYERFRPAIGGTPRYQVEAWHRTAQRDQPSERFIGPSSR